MNPTPQEAAVQRLTTILDNIEESIRVIGLDVAQSDPRTRPALAIRKREAEDNLLGLKSAYKTLVTGGFFKVFVSGKNADKFVEAVSKKPGVLVINGRELYETWAKVVEPTLEHRQRNWTATQSVILTQCMQRFMETNGIKSLNSPKLEGFQADPMMPKFDDVVDRVRMAIRNTNFDDLNVQDIENRLIDVALAAKVTSTQTPVIVTNLSKEELQSIPTRLLAGQPSVFIEANKKVYDLETATETLSKAIETASATKK